MDEFRERNSVNEAVNIACSRVVLDHEWVSAFSLWMHEHHIESPTKLDEQKRKNIFRKMFRKASIKRNLQQQLQEVVQRRHEPTPEHQKVQTRPQNIQSIQDKRRNMQKQSCSTEGDAEDQRGN